MPRADAKPAKRRVTEITPKMGQAESQACAVLAESDIACMLTGDRTAALMADP